LDVTDVGMRADGTSANVVAEAHSAERCRDATAEVVAVVDEDEARKCK
jgi:hypothetical protein